MDDLISRAAAIDACLKGKTDGLPATNVACDCCAERIRVLPSAQPEIIRCKNCKHNQLPSTSGNANCEIFYGMTDQDGFCHMADRRTDDQT